VAAEDAEGVTDKIEEEKEEEEGAMFNRTRLRQPMPPQNKH
jgi:hypothetical protein